jgi:hypothetical protein
MKIATFAARRDLGGNLDTPVRGLIMIVGGKVTGTVGSRSRVVPFDGNGIFLVPDDGVNGEDDEDVLGIAVEKLASKR